ncbi:transcription factor S-II, central domain-containing protein [Circinella umbellata]|nr:transcription factor S-II, central domain-containing protein [Circinella umbellata]
MRQSGDSDYEPAKSPSPPRERRSRTSSASSISSSSVNITPTDSRKSSITSTTTITSKQERSSSKQPEIAPEDDPIRKNVVKNMSTVLKTIIQTALDKDPSLFSVTTTTTTTTTDDDTDQADTSQEKQEEQAQEEKSPEVMGDKIAHSIEQVMFKELRDTHTKRAGAHYKNKFRSLLHNLKDKANEGFQLRVITGELTPDDLVKMSSEDMANPELRSMSKSMRQESIKNSIMKHANVPIIKKTHKGDFIVIGTSDNEESNHNQQQKPSKQQQERQERPLGIQTGANDIFGDDSISRKSSMSETPTTPITVVSRNEREDDQRFEDILAKIGIGHRNSEQEGDDESNDVIGNKRNNITEDVDRPKKRKVEIDMEELLGEDDYRPEFGIDEEENDNNNKDTQQQNDQTEIGSTTPPFPPSSSSSPPPSSKKPPTIWNGRVNMPQVTEFDACARQIGGRALSPMEWSEVLSPTMWIEGRIPVDRVTQYVTQTQYATSREIVLLEIEATGAKNYQNAQTLIKYFDSRKRFGVVGHNKTKIKDFYLIPLYKVQQLPDCLYVVRVEETQRDVDMFLGVVVIQKPQEQPPQPETRIPPTVPVTPSVHTPAPSLPIRHQYQPPPQQRQRMPFSQQYQPPSYLPPQQRQQRLQQQQQQQPQRQRQQGQYQYQRQRQHQHQPYNPSTMYYHPPAP